jgi:SagB-type dehydrogenase family enzyme
VLKFKNMGKKIFILFIIFLLNKEIIMAKNKEIILPKPSLKSNVSLEEAIFKRRSHREFLNKDLDLNQIGQILWAGQGITEEKYGIKFRTAPSAGALYPMELYVFTKEGIFHYLPTGHKLIQISNRDLREKLSMDAWGQKFISQAPLSIVICAVYSRTTKKYGQRGIRYVHMEAGHIAQNIILEATALGLASVCVGAFDDSAVRNSLSISADQEPLYIIAIGYPK